MLTAIITGVVTGCISAWFAIWLRDRFDRNAQHQRWLLDKRAQAVENLASSLDKCLREIGDYYRVLHDEAQNLPFREPNVEYARDILEPLRDKIGRTQNKWRTWFEQDLHRITAWFEHDKQVFDEVSEIGELASLTYENLFMLAENVRLVREEGRLYTEEQLKSASTQPRSSGLPFVGRSLTNLNKRVAYYQRKLVSDLKLAPQSKKRMKHFWRVKRQATVIFWRTYQRVIHAAKKSR